MERQDRDPKEEYNLCGEVYAGTNRQGLDDEVTAMLRLKNLAYFCIHDSNRWQQGPSRVTGMGQRKSHSLAATPKAYDDP